ncbi:non-ribosomal peptide synthetase [Anaeromicropila populeti]|uniref:Amino acid adenylation domain-containing protein n=1 Tax=Anaeromicropila populeti TaxID=37658 RepID=A0A1I6L3T0_9FIRM|nr:non-ribosomal peptide synthetase [Anaeromicropila populeti]SFR98106.1 amino acid adenylation domain-containing protein [Anaeromicropila populeti]
MLNKHIYKQFLNKDISRDEALKLIRNNDTINTNNQYDLSEGQKGIYTSYLMFPQSYAYNTPGAFCLNRDVDRNILERAVKYLVQKHEILRSVFVSDETGVHREIREQAEGYMEYISLDENENINKRIIEENKKYFVLEEGPLFRVIVFEQKKGEKVLFLCFHHIVFDGISAEIFYRELKECYLLLKTNEQLDDNSVDNSYLSFVQKEKEYLLGENAKKDKEYWIKQLSHESKQLTIAGKQLESGEYENDGACCMFELDTIVCRQINYLNVGKPVSAFTKMLTAYMLLLSKYGDEKDIRIGTPITTRTLEFEESIGYYINMIVLRQNINENSTFKELLLAVHNVVLNGLEHSKYPYYDLIRAIGKESRKIIPQLFQGAFYYNSWNVNEEKDFCQHQINDIHQLGEYDLALEVLTKNVDEIIIRFKYNKNIFDELFINKMMQEYINILCAMTNHVNDTIDMHIGKRTKAPGMNSFVQLFYEQVRRTPKAEAVVFEKDRMTYEQLYDSAKKLSEYLKTQNVSKGSYVGILLDRSMNLIIALIAVQMAGGVYIPFDPKYPKDRLGYMFKQTDLQYIITDQEEEMVTELNIPVTICLEKVWPDIQQLKNQMEDKWEEIEPDDLAYILFTSGSTGNPKGIMISHGALANFLISMAECPGCNNTDYILALTTICFDIAGLEMYLMLIAGGTVEILSDAIAKDGIRLLEKLENSKTTILQATPATWQMLLAAGWKDKKNIKVLCGGEALTRELANKLLDRGLEVWNMYGPTETTIWSLVSKVDAEGIIHLGQPIRNTTIYIMDEQMKEVPTGEIGELCIGGTGVAKGYLNNTEETNKKFVYHSGTNEIIYKTGDLVKRMETGEIQYIGRADFQVKINGFRIELSEIEETLLKMEEISQAVVVLKGNKDSKKLAAFLIAQKNSQKLDKEILINRLKEELPDYMVPLQYVYVESYPLTLNQKVDRKQLAGESLIDEKVEEAKEPQEKRASMTISMKAKIQQFLIGEVAKIKELKEELIDVNTNLGEYGFDSISFTTLSVTINAHYNIKINPTNFYNYQTISKFTDYLVQKFADVIEPEKEKQTVTKGKVDLDASQNGIAIVGIGGVLPGSKDLAAFWNNIINEKDLITEIPKERWDWIKYCTREDADPNKMTSKWGGFIPDVDKFDAEFFNISPREAELMDPQQRIMIQVVWEAIENAGYNPKALSGKEIGVFVGATSTDYMEMLLRESEVKAHTLTGISNSIIANRISFLYNFTGPSEIVDTACSSGLVSVHQAVESINSGNCEYAIAGGVNLLLSPFPHIALGKSSMLSLDGRCKAFDEKANGYVRGEGAVALFLKPIDKAIQDGDQIYAVIKGTAVNHCGKTNSLTAPNPTAQCELIKKAFHKAKMDPSTVGYIETHGTGTALGDPIEINGLTMAYSDLFEEWGISSNDSHCGIGSIKTNIGHLEAASGLAGLLKIILAIQHKQIPANLHFQKMNPYITLENTPFYILKEKKEWENLVRDGEKIPLRAGVSAFGFGGTNAHVLVEEYIPADRYEENNNTNEKHAVIISAQYKEGVQIKAKQLLDYITETVNEREEKLLSRIAYTLQTGREAMKYRAAFLVTSINELKNKLENYTVNGQSDDCSSNDKLSSTVSRWTNGENVDWNEFYSVPLEKIALPTYPFEKSRYWISMQNNNHTYHDSKKQPLIDEVLLAKSLRNGVTFQKLVTAQDFIAKDHVVKGNCVMPGTSYLEMALEGVSHFETLSDVKLQNVYWLQQLIVEQDKQKQIHIIIEQKEEGYYYQVESEAESKILHGSGFIVPINEKNNEKPKEISEIKARCGQYISKQDFYQWIQCEADIYYGPYFQGLQEIYLNNEEVFAKIQLSQEIQNEQPFYFIHPVIMDCALQAMASLIGNEKGKGKTKIPFSVEEIIINGALKEECYYVHVTRERDGVHTICLLDEEGNGRVTLKNLVSREIQEEQYLFLPKWSMIHPKENIAESRINRRILVLYSDESETVKNQIISIVSAADIIEVNINDVADYENYIKKDSIDQILFLGGIVTQYNLFGYLEDFEEIQNRGIVAFYQLIKSLHNVGRDMEICIITNNCFCLAEEETIPSSAAMYSFSKTAMLENPNLKIRLYDIELSNEQALLEEMKKIVRRTGMTEQIMIRDHCWYQKEISPIQWQNGLDGKSAFQYEGTYLLVGMGGINQVIGTYLAANYRASIIYVSKSELNEERSLQLEKIQELGGKASYLKTDITIASEVKYMMRNVLQNYEKLNGVILGAMVLQDVKISSMTEEQLRTVMKPKVHGTIELLKALKNVSLDFLLVLSSTNAVIGNVGQSNYNAACACQDALAMEFGRRTKTTVKIINWSYWGSVGAVSSSEYNEKLKKIGLFPIQIEEGMKVIEQVLLGSCNQVIMFKAAENILREVGFRVDTVLIQYPEKIPSKINHILVKNEVNEEILRLEEGFGKIEKLGAQLVLKYFQKANLFLKAHTSVSYNEIETRLRVVPKYKRLLNALLSILEVYEYVTSLNNVFVATKKAEIEYFEEEFESKYPEINSYVKLMKICADKFDVILSGQVSYGDVMFPGGSKELVEGIYKGNAVIDYFNDIVSQWIKKYISERVGEQPDCKVNILEIGAGTGGTSLGIFKNVNEYRRNINYLYSDISASFTNYGENKYSKDYPFITFQVLDIEKNPLKQNFIEDSFDIVVATNVLHATSDMLNTLSNIKLLMKNAGVILINEITDFKVFSTLTFGLTEGWWNYTDELRIKDSPLLSTTDWKKILLETGFEYICMFPDKEDWDLASQHIIAAESNGIVTVNENADKNADKNALRAEPSKNVSTGKSELVKEAAKDKLTIQVEESDHTEQLYDKTIQWLKEEFSALLKTDMKKITPESNVEKMGVDSLLVIEIHKKWSAIFPKLASTVLFEYNTIDKIAAYLTDSYENELQKLFHVEKKLLPKKKEDVNLAEQVSARDKSISSMDIAIIGVSGKYPMAEDIYEFWDNLRNGKDCVSIIPEERWKWVDYFDETNSKQGRSYSKWGGFLRDIDGFDAEFFEITNEQADEMDPQERLLLESTWSTLEDAGYPGKRLADAGVKVGVFIGTMYGGYGQLAAKAWESGVATNAQSAHWMLSNRISYHFNFNGPSIAVDTACSSSMTAIHYACKSIQSGECEQAVAGGINLILTPRQHVRLANLNSLSRTGKTQSFNANADGFVEGEGVGTVLLKPLEQAVKDHDHIYAVIKGSSVNSNGASSNFTTPSITEQANAIRYSLMQQQIDPATINYVEAHATGTVLGDPIEVSALNRALGEGDMKKQNCPIGTVKSNIGHIEAASGIAALTKVLLQMKYKKLVPSIHCEPISPFIPFENSRFYVQKELSEWDVKNYLKVENNSGKRRACINSNGAGGSNANLIIDEFEKAAYSKKEQERKDAVITLSAQSEWSLKNYVKSLERFLQKQEEEGIYLSYRDIAYTLQTCREEMKTRIAFVISSYVDLKNKLSEIVLGKQAEIYQGDVEEENSAVKIDLADLSMQRIAMEWVKGGRVDWEKLYQTEDSVQKIPLPTYCFHHTRHWITGNKQRYNVSFKGDEPYILGHCSFGEYTIMGMTYVSILNNYLQTNQNEEVIKIHKMMFLETASLGKEDLAEIYVDVSDTNTIECIASIGNHKKIVSRAEKIDDFEYNVPQHKIPDFTNGLIHAGTKLYQLKPNVYSPDLQCIDAVLVEENEVWGKLSLSNTMKQDKHEYLIHPALLDGAILCRLALKKENDYDKYIPFLIKELYFCGKTGETCYCHIKQIQESAELWEGNIEVMDESGRIAIEMKGVVCKKVFTADEERQENDGTPEILENNTCNGQQEDEITEYVKKKIENLTGKPLGVKDISKNIMSLGCDSIKIISLCQEIQSEIGVELYPTVFFEHPSVIALARYFTNNYANRFYHICKPMENKRTVSLKEDYHVKEDHPVKENHLVKDNEPIAIIGISGVFPQSSDLDEFWEKIGQNQNLVTTIPEERWNWKDYYKNKPDDDDKTNVIWGGFIKDVDKFDPEFFGISPREAKLMDPQQRLCLELAWSVIEDAGYDPKELAGSKTGVYIGVADHDYNDIGISMENASRSQILTGNAHNILTGRISYLFDFHGPSEPVDTACASSLIALIHAAEAIQNGRCDMALAGGVHIMLNPSMYVSFDSLGILSRDGKCRTFDKDANGTVRGEGAGLVLLKKYSQAVEDKDHIYAVIKGTGVSHGGFSNSMTAPNPAQQEMAILDAMERGNIDPGTISYIETHGTGTILGDPIEITSLKNAFTKMYQKKNLSLPTNKFCGLGALKTQIGHLETAAGIAGILKLILCMKYGMLPGIQHFNELNPYINLEDTPFYIVKEPKKWERLIDPEGNELPYCAGVSAFGFSGVNAHILLEEYREEQMKCEKESSELIVLSAKNRERLTAYANSFSSYIRKRAGNWIETSGKAVTQDEAILDDRNDIIEYIISFISDVSGTLKSDIDRELPMTEYALSPLQWMQLIDGVNKKFNKNLSIEIINSNHSINKIFRNMAGIKADKKVCENIETHLSQLPPLSELAETLRKGRTPMEERLAVIAENYDELLQCLEQYIDKNYNSDKLYCKENISIKEQRSNTDILNQLAYNWVSGEDIKEQETLKKQKPKQKVSLPTYPFEKKRCWADNRLNCKGSLEKIGDKAFVEQKLADSPNSIYKKTLVSKEFYLRDHIVNGKCLLPGVVYIEMARQAGECDKTESKVVKISKIVWSKPIQVSTAYRNVQIELKKKEQSTLFEIATAEEGIHAQGKIVYGEVFGTNKERLHYDEEIHQYGDNLRKKEFYDLFERCGFQYGNTFKPIETIYFNEDEAIGLLQAEGELFAEFNKYVLHPVILEGSLQTAGYLLNKNSNPTNPYVPFAIEEITIYDSLPQRCFAHARLVQNRTSDNQKEVDITIYNMSGKVLLEIKKYMVRSMSGADKKYEKYEAVRETTANSISSKEKQVADSESYIEDELLNIVSNILGIEKQDIDVEKELEYYNMDSMLLTEFSNKINAKFNCDLTPASFFEIEPLTLRKIVKYMNEKYGEITCDFEQEYIEQEYIEKEYIEQQETDAGAALSKQQEPIAIVGMSGRMPMSDDCEEFWKNLMSNESLISEIPENRFNWREYYGDAIKEENKTNSRWGGFMKQVDKFDAGFFNITPKEARLMDPQQRIFYETVWELLEDAGYTKKDVYGSRTGVYLGVSNLDYSDIVHKYKTDALTMTGNNHPLIVNKISHFFNFTGPSEPVDTLCSSSLVAIHRAVEDIRNGMCDMAIAGGINVILTPSLYISYGNANMLSSDGKCKTFDKSADGFVRGEGVGALLLKPLSKAIEDRDHIYATIRGSAVNHGGHSKSLTAPNPNAQAEVIKMALRRSGIDFHTVNYIELHGTGTALGDPIEINGLKMVYEDTKSLESTVRLDKCVLGAVKTNVGHLESAAGIAGVLKIILAMQHKVIPANLNLNTLNPYVDLGNTPFYLPLENEEWESVTDKNGMRIPRRAGISSFGAGGVNAHIIFEEYTQNVKRQSEPDEAPYPFVLSAKDSERLQTYVNKVLLYLQGTAYELKDIAYTSVFAREEMETRLAVVASDRNELISKLNDYLGGRRTEGCYCSEYNEAGYGKNTGGMDYGNRDLKSICQAWVSGDSINWNAVFAQTDYKKVSFPKYPFQKNRYWVSDNQELVQKIQDHKCEDEFVYEGQSTEQEIKYKIKLFKNADYIKDHVIEGNIILPGVVYLELARFAALKGFSKKVSGLEEITWVQPIIFTEPEVEVFVSFSIQSGTEKISFKIESKTNAGEALHCKGLLSFEKLLPEIVSVDEIKERCQDMIDKSSCYKRFTDFGFEYGSSYQTIQNAYIGTDEVFIELSADKKQKGFVLNPSVLDGMLQSTMVDSVNMEAEDIYLPYAIENIQWTDEIPQAAYVYAKSITQQGNSYKNKEYQIFLITEDGMVHVKIHKFVKRKSNTKRDNILLCQEEWWEEEQQPAINSGVRNRIVVFSENPAFESELKNELGMKDITFIRENEYYPAFQKLKETEYIPTKIVYAKSIKADCRAEQVVFDLMELVKAAAKVFGKNKMEFIYLYVKTDSINYAYHKAMSGFLKSVMLEFEHYSGRTIEVELEKAAVQCAKELKMPDYNSFVEIRYSGNRKVKKLREFEFLQDSKKPAFRENGIYLISGGMGGIGILLTKYLLQKYQANVMMVGRSQKNAKIEQQLQELNALGGTCTYSTVDITDKEEMQLLHKEIENSFGNLNGVLHLAGTVKDSYLLRKTKKQMEEVFAPKIQGTIYLDEMTKDYKLDFFTMFSSITGVLGNSGQSDYAYANHFMDAFVFLRNQMQEKGKRFGKTCSVNWPLWRHGGMKIDKLMEDRMKQTTGFESMSDVDGIKYLERTLECPQFMVLAGDKIKMKKLFQIKESNPGVVSETVIDLEETKDTFKYDHLKTLTIDFLKEAIAEVSEIPIDKIREKLAFDRYGIDSVMLIKLGSKLEPILGKVSNTIFFEYQNIEELANYLNEEQNDLLINYFKMSGHLNEENKELNKDVRQVDEKVLSISQTVKVEPQNIELVNRQDIAIIGMSGKFPMADNISEFWEKLREGINCISEIPESRWNGDKLFSANKEDVGKSYSKWGGFITGVDEFDPMFFHIAPAEAELMDPQERLFVQEVWKTLENAGSTRSELGTDVGVFVGVMYKHYPWIAKGTEMENLLSCTSYWEIANRVSYLFDFQGPSYAIDTACSSSLTAVHLACESIKRGECKTAIAGGVNLNLTQMKYVGLSQTKMIGSYDRSMSLGKGDGYVPGEGVGAVLLKPLSEAIKDNDHIYGVIKSTLSNHGGRTNGFAVPNPVVQAELVTKTIQNAGLKESDINYIEVAANGSELGDMVEVNALKRAFAKKVSKKSIPIGTVKGNVGHLEAASGMSQLIKVLLQMEKKAIVPIISAESSRDDMNLNNSPFYLEDQFVPWKIEENQKRRALISSYGAGGANTSIIVEEYENTVGNTEPDVWPDFFAFSANSKDALHSLLVEMRDFILTHEEQFNFKDMSYTLLAGREALEERIGIVANSKEDLIEKLNSCMNGEKQAGIFEGYVVEGTEETALTQNESILSKLQLAVLWTNGAAVNVKAMESYKNCKKIALPSYPFAKEKYWLQEKTDAITEIKERQIDENYFEQGTSIEDTLKTVLSSLTKVPVDKINVDTPLHKYGFDSLTGMRFMNQIKSIYGIKLQVNDIFKNFTIRKMEVFLSSRVKHQSSESNMVVQLEQRLKGKEKEFIVKELLIHVKNKTVTPEEAMRIQNRVLLSQ